MASQQEIVDRIKEVASDLVVSVELGKDWPVVVVDKSNLIRFMKFLKEDEVLQFELINDVTAVDWFDRKPRFDVVYHIFSMKNNQRIRVKTMVDDGESVESVTSIWDGANWLERETYDMFGIKFDNHPDLRRILMEEDFKYYPLRKEFPLEGIED